MFRFLCKSIPSPIRTSELCKLYSTSLQNGTQDSFTVQYLVNRCGVSMERAVLYSSNHINFDNPDQPDSVFSFFINQGFTDTQIRKVVAAEPRILSFKPQRTLLPKILYFRSKGVLTKDLARILVPIYFRISLEKCIVPSFNFINDIISSEKDAILAISNCPRILLKVESHVKPNIEILLGAGMSQSAIARLLKTRPSIFVRAQDRLKKSIKQVQNMKMDTESCGYFLALSTKARKLISLQNGNQGFFTVQYLIDHFGISMEKAVLYSSKHLNFEKPDKPDSVISFFKSQGFTETQIRKVVADQPRILSYNPQKTLLPKILFLRSKGFLEKVVARILVPTYFRRSLENFIVPSFNFIKDFIGSEKDAIFAISDCPRILLEVESHVKPNIRILLGAGVSQSAIARLMKSRPYIFVTGQDKLKESVKQVENMDMDPESCGYGLALWILTVTRKRRTTWDKRMEAYKRWGCSENDVLRSSMICPNIMKISEERLNGIMSLFVHEIGWEPSDVVKRYFMFTLSLKKRMIPRWSVYQELLSKGLVKKKVGLSTMFRMKQDLFLHKFVNLYKDEAPLLLKLFVEKQASN